MAAPDASKRTEPRIAAVIVAHARADMARACVESVLAQGEQRVQVIVVLNDAKHEVAELMNGLAERDPRVLTAISTGTSPSEARNIGLDRAEAPILYFLDDDVRVPADGIERVLALFDADPELCILGGPNLTPPEDPEFAQMVGELLGSAWGTGVTRARYAPCAARAASERHLILCNLAVRRIVFDSGLRFPVLFGGEENVLMGRADHAGHRLWYSPDAWVYHHRRRTLRTYVEQIYRYGRGRALALLWAPRTLHVGYLAPVALLVYVTSLPLLLPITPLSLLPIAAYGVGTLIASARIAIRCRRPSWLLGLPPLFVVTHVVYGVGLVVTLVGGLLGPERNDDAGRQVTQHGR